MRLVATDAERLRALYEGREEWPAQDRRMLGYRMQALKADPSAAPYLLHLIVDESGEVLGRIGAHSAPDEQGEVEIGYSVRPHARGRGVAGEAVDAFLHWLRDQGVLRVRATVAPDNLASRRILERRGFVETGTQIDDEDGLELVYELDLRQ